MTHRRIVIASLAALAAAIDAAENAPPTPTPPPDAAEFQRLRDEVRDLRQRVDTLGMSQVAIAIATADAADELRESVNALERAEPKPRVGDAEKGFIPIPGTRTAIRFGGTARLDANLDFDDAGNPNQFIPSTIPLEGSSGDAGGERFAMNAKGSRISAELRTPLPGADPLKIYYENDFYGDSSAPAMNYRLRHLYGQGYGFLVGQTFSGFQDVDSWPDTLDYQGPNAMVNRRVPQARWMHTLDEGLRVFAGIEQPAGDIALAGAPTGAEIVDHAPDLTFGIRVTCPGAHLQLAGLTRYIGYRAGGEGDSSLAGGLNLSGSLQLTPVDKLVGAVAGGWGIARYINELGGLGLDAVIDADGDVKPLGVFAPAAGLTHRWNPQWRTTVGYGYVRVTGEDDLRAGSSFEDSHYAFANLVWKPGAGLTVGVESLYGRRDTVDDEHGDAWRVALMCKFDLFR